MTTTTDLKLDYNELKTMYAHLKEVNMHGFQLTLFGPSKEDNGNILWERTSGFLDETTDNIILPYGASSGPYIGIRKNGSALTFDFMCKVVFDGYSATPGFMAIIKEFFGGLSDEIAEIRAVWTLDSKASSAFSMIA